MLSYQTPIQYLPDTYPYLPDTYPYLPIYRSTNLPGAATPDSVRCTNARAVLAGLEFFGQTKRKLNNGVLLAAANASFLAAWRADYADYRPSVWDFNS